MCSKRSSYHGHHRMHGAVSVISDEGLNRVWRNPSYEWWCFDKLCCML